MPPYKPTRGRVIPRGITPKTKTSNLPMRTPYSPTPVTPPATLSAPHSISPTPHSILTTPSPSTSSVPRAAIVSPTPVEFQIVGETDEIAQTIATEAADTDEESVVQNRGDRGAYLSKNIPKKPSERTLLHVIGQSRYLESVAVGSITKDFKAHFRGKTSQWHLLDEDVIEHFYKCFQDRFRHEETVTPEQARQIWEERAKDRCRGTWALVRKNCKNVTKSDDPSDWKGCKPKFVNVDDWNDILKSWTEPEWKLRSVVGAKNRKSVPGEEEGTCSYVRHTGGPVSFDVHEYRLEEKFGKSISEIEFYETFHKSKKGEGDWCDVRSQKVAMKYKEAIIVPDEADDANEISVSDIPFDPEAWVKATGVPMKDNIYGFGRTNIAKKIHQLANPSKRKRSTTCSSTLMDDEAFIDSQVNTRVEAILESQVDARVESRLDDLRAEMREERKLEMEEIMRMFNIQQKTMSSRE